MNAVVNEDVNLDEELGIATRNNDIAQTSYVHGMSRDERGEMLDAIVKMPKGVHHRWDAVTDVCYQLISFIHHCV